MIDEEKLKKLLPALIELDTDERQSVMRMLKSHDAFMAIDDIGNDLFRPARKHGYPDRKIQGCLEACGENGFELVSLLEDKFYEILEEREISHLLF